MALIEEFKQRIHIFHSVEDDNLNRILEASQAAVTRMTGVNDLNNPEFKELVLERGRYAYNDQLEFFEENFQSELLGLSAEILPTDDGEIDKYEDGDSDGNPTNVSVSETNTQNE
ncbi:MAG: phage gp6-like head-tail connector protein [Liquorilactobacillus ghanensis]|uniref:phage gp6-like head-tail connector protein n=1 Tax=Liquorilactobacillus ghanensis TaxID=399370 RepID=UPI0039EA0E73